MIMYFIIGLLWIATTYGTPVNFQNFKSTPLVYYTPTSSQYVQENVYPFVQYPNESPAFGKALHSVQTPNELLFYPNSAVIPQQPVIVSAQTTNIPVTRFTAPPSELVDAVYAWFNQNNIPLPEGANKNEASIDKIDTKDQENTDKTAGEADVLAEADKIPNVHYPKKPVTPKFRPGQRFFILNGQPQFYSNYQPLYSQILTRNTVPADTQNILIFQPQNDIQQPNYKLKNAARQYPTGQNVVLVQDQIAPEIKPLRYHGADLKQQNIVLLRENQRQNSPQIQVQQLPTYSRQQLLIGRLLPQTQDIKQQQITQTPIHQTHYVPVEVVPPQIPQFQTTQPFYQNQEIAQQDDNPQELAVLHIPVDRNIQLPNYISAKPERLPVLHNLQQTNSGKHILYLSPEAQTTNSHQTVQNIENQEQQQIVAKQQSEVNDVPPGIAALEFARYIASRQGDLYSDSVVIDAKTEESNKEENDSDVVQADVPAEPSIAQAHPGGIALAGLGGVAATAPRGTALVGEKGLAVASPHATAVAGPNTNKSDKEYKGL